MSLGRPTCRGGPGSCRADNDGIITNGLNPDGGVDINDQLAFLALFEIGDPRGDLADVNGFTVPDEACDINDLLFFQQMFEQGYTHNTSEPVRFGWRGYLWDGKLNVHHVRHRVFDPKLMTWPKPARSHGSGELAKGGGCPWRQCLGEFGFGSYRPRFVSQHWTSSFGNEA